MDILNPPCIDMNCPSLSAAPRIRLSVATSRRTLASDMNTLPSPPPPAVRRIVSVAAPIPSDAANAEKELAEDGRHQLTAIVEQPAEAGRRHRTRAQRGARLLVAFNRGEFRRRILRAREKPVLHCGRHAFLDL